mmetsp:Transcript_68222/g.215813  ORF Transcript_68222/g.215813 Transcript_68222/m.215813 type:complete len:183 (+) Transcript_68222:130-678(+)
MAALQCLLRAGASMGLVGRGVGGAMRPVAVGSATSFMRYFAKESGDKESKKPRATSAYVFFVKDKFNTFKTDGEKLGDTSKKVSAAWKAMSNAEKAPYEAKAAISKKEVAAMIEEAAPADSKPPKAKRAMSGYNLFTKEKMEESRRLYPNLANKDHMKSTSGLWKNMREAEKQEYIDRAKAM